LQLPTFDNFPRIGFSAASTRIPGDGGGHCRLARCQTRPPCLLSPQCRAMKMRQSHGRRWR